MSHIPKEKIQRKIHHQNKNIEAKRKKKRIAKSFAASICFWLLHNQHRTLHILCTVVAHTPEKCPANSTIFLINLHYPFFNKFFPAYLFRNKMGPTF